MAVCIVGSVVEELVFRGLIYNALARAFRSPVPAITISGLAFGIWHGNLIQSVYTAIMGMIIAFVYYKTKKLVFPILLHMLNNLISTPLPAIQDTVIADMINYGCIIMIIPFIVLFYRVFFRKDGAGVQAV